MKRCPECRRDYYDDTLLYCLDDGNALFEGPGATWSSDGEQATAILSGPLAVARGLTPSESPTTPQINSADQTAILPPGIGGGTSKKIIIDSKVWVSQLTSNGTNYSLVAKDGETSRGGFQSWIGFIPSTMGIVLMSNKFMTVPTKPPQSLARTGRSILQTRLNANVNV